MNRDILRSMMRIIVLCLFFVMGCKSNVHERTHTVQGTMQHESEVASQEQEMFDLPVEYSDDEYMIGNGLVEKMPQEHTQDTLTPIEGVRHANQEALQEPTEHTLQNSLVVYNYWENYLYRIYTSPQRVTAIQLSSDEEVVGELVAGDTANWMIAMSQDREKPIIYIKPIKEDISTNLIINTTRRTYYLVLVGLPQTYMVSVEWRYPQLEMQKKNDKKTVLEEKVSLGSLYFGYKIIPYRKAPLWIPSKIFDDGVRTYIHFPNKLALSEYPALFMTDTAGSTVLVNYRVIEDYYVLDRILYKGELRVGTKKRDAIKIVRLRE